MPWTLMTKLLIQDPLWNRLKIIGLEREIINTIGFQRLRLRNSGTHQSTMDRTHSIWTPLMFRIIDGAFEILGAKLNH